MCRSTLNTIILLVIFALSGIVIVAQDSEETNKEAVRAAYAEYSEDNPYALSNILREPFMMNQGDDTLYETSYVDAIEYLGVKYLCNGAVSGNWWGSPLSLDEFAPVYAVIDLYEDGSSDHRMMYYDSNV